MVNQWIMLGVGVLLGCAAGYLWVSARAARNQTEARSRIEGLEAMQAALREQLATLQSQKESAVQETRLLQEQVRQESNQRTEAQTRLSSLQSAVEDLAGVRQRLEDEKEARARAETQLQEAQANLEGQRRLLDDAREKLVDTFKALSADALQGNNQAFLNVAQKAFEALQIRAQGDLEGRQKEIQSLVLPLKESLDKYEQHVIDLENARQKAYGSLDQQLNQLTMLHQELQKQTTTLATALKGGPQVKGRWGEMQLRQVVELAGMAEHCDFIEQETLETETGRSRPDMIIQLPGGRQIAVDSKVPLDAFQTAAAANSERERKEALASYSQNVRQQITQLSARNYAGQLSASPEIVVLFMPGESFFSAALEQDQSLLVYAMEKRVMLATPTTLIALLLAVAYGWRQEKIQKNAQEISEQGRLLYDRLRTFLSHFIRVGLELKSAVENYNKATGSLESRVLIAARRFKELGVAGGDEIPSLDPIEAIPRELAAPERGEGA